MQYIGLADKYYTLWEVSEPYREYTSKYSYYMKRNYTYIQNLSFNLDKAKSKVSGDYVVDLKLRGHKSFVKKTSDLLNDAPSNVFAFGQYEGEPFNKTSDLNYLKWYYDQTKNEEVKEILIKCGYVMYEGELINHALYETKIKAEKEKEFEDSLSKGHHFTEKKRIDIEIKKIKGFSFDSFYGRTYIDIYASKCGKLVKYMGSNPPKIEDEYVKVKATIKHDEYNGVDETKLQRIKIL